MNFTDKSRRELSCKIYHLLGRWTLVILCFCTAKFISFVTENYRACRNTINSRKNRLVILIYADNWHTALETWFLLSVRFKFSFYNEFAFNFYNEFAWTWKPCYQLQFKVGWGNRDSGFCVNFTELMFQPFWC